MITVELKGGKVDRQNGSEIEIFCDSDGLSLLIRQLRHLEAGSTHVHLMTPSWAGTELDEQLVGGENSLVSHMRVVRIPDSRKNGNSG